MKQTICFVQHTYIYPSLFPSFSNLYFMFLKHILEMISLKYYCISNADIDECFLQRYDCSTSAKCMNTNGSFMCVCSTGYQLQDDGITCQGTREESGMTLHDKWNPYSLQNHLHASNEYHVHQLHNYIDFYVQCSKFRNCCCCCDIGFNTGSTTTVAYCDSSLEMYKKVEDTI